MSKRYKGIDWEKWYDSLGNPEPISPKEERRNIIIFVSTAIILMVLAFVFDGWIFFMLIPCLWIALIIFKSIFSLFLAAFQQFIGTWKK